MPSGPVASLCVAGGGALGSLARFWIGILAQPVSRQLPWGTIGINVVGSFVIGLFGTLTLAGGRHPAPEWARLLVMVGFCGGFTTFSSFSLQTLDLIRAGGWTRAGVNIVVSVCVCLAAVAAGHAIGAALGGGAETAQLIVEDEA